jgi:hypothetical protein
MASTPNGRVQFVLGEKKYGLNALDDKISRNVNKTGNAVGLMFKSLISYIKFFLCN